MKGVKMGSNGLPGSLRGLDVVLVSQVGHGSVDVMPTSLEGIVGEGMLSLHNTLLADVSASWMVNGVVLIGSTVNGDDEPVVWQLVPAVPRMMTEEQWRAWVLLPSLLGRRRVPSFSE